jgi:hypothetical protein
MSIAGRDDRAVTPKGPAGRAARGDTRATASPRTQRCGWAPYARADGRSGRAAAGGTWPGQARGRAIGGPPAAVDRERRREGGDAWKCSVVVAWAAAKVAPSRWSATAAGGGKPGAAAGPYVGGRPRAASRVRPPGARVREDRPTSTAARHPPDAVAVDVEGRRLRRPARVADWGDGEERVVGGGHADGDAGVGGPSAGLDCQVVARDCRSSPPDTGGPRDLRISSVGHP